MHGHSSVMSPRPRSRPSEPLATVSRGQTERLSHGLGGRLLSTWPALAGCHHFTSRPHTLSPPWPAVPPCGRQQSPQGRWWDAVWMVPASTAPPAGCCERRSLHWLKIWVSRSWQRGKLGVLSVATERAFVLSLCLLPSHPQRFWALQRWTGVPVSRAGAGAGGQCVSSHWLALPV